LLEEQSEKSNETLTLLVSEEITLSLETEIPLSEGETLP